QLRSITYWFIQFTLRNSSSKQIQLEISQFKAKEAKNDDVNFSIRVNTIEGEKILNDKLKDLKDYIELDHRRTKFIEDEILEGLNQVTKMIKINGGKIMVNLESQKPDNGIEIFLNFKK
ncbi:MAG: hypothetical protein AAFV80_07915, partial [Bacteroidota bacterium]